MSQSTTKAQSFMTARKIKRQKRAALYAHTLSPIVSSIREKTQTQRQDRIHSYNHNKVTHPKLGISVYNLGNSQVSQIYKYKQYTQLQVNHITCLDINSLSFCVKLVSSRATNDQDENKNSINLASDFHSNGCAAAQLLVRVALEH